MIKYLLIFILTMNVLSFCLMGIDKRRAVKGKSDRRIPERVLLWSGFLMGSFGLLLGALVWHHKTKKTKFRIGIPAAILVNVLVMVFALSAFVVWDVKDDVRYTCVDDATLDQAVVDELKAGNYQCALVLGCAVYSDGEPTPMLRDRLDVGIALYKAGVVPKLLLSGDHGQDEYNEISTMYEYCISQGVADADIFLDHAGFSTYESVYRAQSIFQVERMVVVTQTYHEYRALYIARVLGIDSVGVASDQKSYFGASYREFREVLARDKDYFKSLLRLPPTYGGNAIPITGPVYASRG